MKWMRLFLLTMLFSLPAYSLNMTFLIGTAAQHFTKEDRQMFNAALDTALDKTPNGKKVEWKNSATQNGGYLLPLSNTSKNGLTCRNMKIVNVSIDERLPDQYTFLFCKSKKGWVVYG